jgi:hypothetical protein
MGRVGDFLEKRGVAPRDIPKGLIMLKTCSYCIWMGGVVVCYKFQPLLRILPQSTKLRLAQAESRLGARLSSRVHMKERLNSVRERIKQSRQEVFQRRADALKARHGWPQKFADYVEKKAEHVAENSFVRSTANFFKLNAKRLALAVAEAFVLYKITIPFHLPLQIWLVISALKHKNVKGQNITEIYEDQNELDEEDPPGIIGSSMSTLQRQQNQSILIFPPPSDDVLQRYLRMSPPNTPPA